MKSLARMRRWTGIQFRLSTAILVGASLLVMLLAGAYSALAYERLARETMQSVKTWSQSVAQLVSTSNISAFVLNDVASVESNLLQVAGLPGVDNIAVFRADGRMLTQAYKNGDSITSMVGGSEHMVLPLQGTKTIQGSIKDGFYESWAGIEAGSAYPAAWVRVRYSLNQRSQELERLWHQSLLATLLMMVVMVVGLHLVISRALRPIRLLSDFAVRMPSEIGSQIDIAEGCVEVNQLGSALNLASRGIAEQVGRVRAIVNTAAEAIIGLDDQGKISSVNPAASSFFGRPEAELIGHPFDQCVPGLSTSALQEMFGNAAGYASSVSRIVRQDFSGTRLDGTLFPVEISLGQVQGIGSLRYVCIVRDITDERAALEFSELYERALACSHNAVFITNAKLAHQPIVYINEAFQKMTGLPPHKVLGSSLNILRSQANKDDPELDELDMALREQRNATTTLYRTRPDGSPLIAEVSLSPVRADSGKVTNFVGIASEVTDRVQAEVAIAERRAQIDAIFSLSPDGFVLFDAQDNIVFANPAFERMTGLQWMSDKAMSIADFEQAMAHLCDPEHPFPSMQARGEDDQWKAQLHLARPQHRVVQAQTRRNVAGRSETILYFRDVTHEDTVDRMKSEFLAAAAHELRTPMVSIFGFTELLLKRKFSEERRTDMLETIHRQSGLLVKMINELLDLARIESRRGLDLQISESPLNELVQSSVKGLMRPDTERQVQVGAVPDVAVLIDPEKMQLAMNNLLSNAFKYSPQGGKVSLNARIDHDGDKAFVVIDIRDQGIGMTPEQLDRAFERFYRADASGNIPGTGLGLSMVKEVAELHNGKIMLASEAGQGTTASLWIPMAKFSAPASPRAEDVALSVS
jgi:PAS domain S-box-containing protein